MQFTNFSELALQKYYYTIDPTVLLSCVGSLFSVAASLAFSILFPIFRTLDFYSLLSFL